MNDDIKAQIPFSKSNDPEQDLQLLEPYNYVLQVPGKKVRQSLLLAFNHWLKVDEKYLEQIGKIIQVLHNASLLLDDIQDNSVLRRGIPVAHKIFGVPSTINSANYVMFIALEQIQALGKPEAVQVFTEQMLELHRGQGMDIYWRDNHLCPTEDEYKQMTIRKTGGLFNLAVRLMQLFSDHASKSDFGKLSKLFGLFYQVRDDYANLQVDEYTKNKSFAEDLTEGKFSFPIIHAINASGSDHKVLQILKQRTNEESVKKYCIHLLETAGSFQYTRDYMEKLRSEILEEIQNLGGNPKFEMILQELDLHPKAK